MTVNIDKTLLQKYAPVIASALVLLLPAVDILAKNPTPIAILQFVALALTTVTTLRLVAPWKQILEWAGVIVATLLPLALSGEITWANWAFVAVAIVKALAVHFGVTIRKDDTIDARESTGVPIVTSLPAAALPTTDALVVGDGLADPANTAVPDGPRHAAATDD